METNNTYCNDVKVNSSYSDEVIRILLLPFFFFNLNFAMYSLEVSPINSCLM